MDILTAEQWAEWRLSPVTQAFLKYITHKKYEISRRKMDMMSGPVSAIDGYALAELNGMERTCTGILQLDLGTMTSETRALEEIGKDYKKMVKDSFGIDM